MTQRLSWVCLLNLPNLQEADCKCKILSVIICLCGEGLLGKTKPKLYSDIETETKIGTKPLQIMVLNFFEGGKRGQRHQRRKCCFHFCQ